MKHNYRICAKNVLLRPLEERDIEQLRIWRNDPLKTKYLRKIEKITPEMQKDWFERYLVNSDEITFAIEETKDLKRMVGSVSLYNFHEGVAEAGRIQIGDDAAHGRGIASLSMALVCKFAFNSLKLRKVIASVHRENVAAYKSYMKIGFHVVGFHPALMGGVENEIEITETDLELGIFT